MWKIVLQKKKKTTKKNTVKNFYMTFLSTISTFYVIAIFLVFIILWNTNWKLWKLHMSNAKKKSINYFQTHHDAFISAFPKEIFIGYECIFSSLTLHTQICHCDEIRKNTNRYMINLTKSNHQNGFKIDYIPTYILSLTHFLKNFSWTIQLGYIWPLTHSATFHF